MNQEIMCILLNTTGLFNKIDFIKAETVKQKVDVWFLTETWLKTNICVPGFHCYNAVNQNSDNPRGSAGCSVLISSNIDVNDIKLISKDDKYGRFLILKIFEVAFCVIYLSPSLNTQEAMGILTHCYFETARENQNRMMMIGDFNAHMQYLENKPSRPRGLAILKFIEEKRLKIFNRPSDFTFKLNGAQSVLDLVIGRGIQPKKLPETNNEMTLGKGGHVPLEFSFEITRNYSRPLFVTSRKLLLQKLKNPEIIREISEKWKVSLSDQIKEFQKHIEEINESAVNFTTKRVNIKNLLSKSVENFHSSLYQLAAEILGTKALRKKQNQMNIHPKILYHIN